MRTHQAGCFADFYLAFGRRKNCILCSERGSIDDVEMSYDIYFLPFDL